MNKPTKRLPITSRSHQIKWGTANLGPEGLVNIHVGSPTAEPIPTHLTHPVILGRSDEDDPDIHVNLVHYEAAQKGVSRRHALLEVIDKNVMLTDLNSTNGTFLNGQRLQANQRRIARDSDEIQLGQLLLYIFFEKQPPDIEDASYQAIKKYAHDIK